MKFQAPKGTRDFYPQDMARRNYLIDAWRAVSIRNGYEQVDGPIFESLDLYKVKSGEGIVSELFHFEDRGGRELAIRPEFTPTLARMVAEKANSLPKPIKWFCTPNFCRAERPQRGRLREFWQWNVDILGLDSPLVDAECIFTAVDLFRHLGLRKEHVRVKISHRQTVSTVLAKLGVPAAKMVDAFNLLDSRDKMVGEEFVAQAAALGLDSQRVERFDQICRMKYQAGEFARMRDQLGLDQELAELQALDQQLAAFGIADWCEYDLGIVRGLAYYTGTVFEMHEVSGAERAIAGGGRYDGLIELFGGPAMPAVGFGMGDVVLSNVLLDKGLLPADASPRPAAFVVAATEAGAAALPAVVGRLRGEGVHARFSYKAGRNVGKLLKEAAASGARYALILGDELQRGQATLKDLGTGQQEEIPLAAAAARMA